MGLQLGAIGSFHGVREEDFGAKRFYQTPFRRRILRHDQLNPNPQGRADHGVGNARVPRSGIQEILSLVSSPDAKASNIMFFAGRSFTDPPGFINSALA
jgi:hypothetical protein